MPLDDRFWAKVMPEPMSGCWLWAGALSKGYGHFALTKGDVRNAHRLAYEELVGPIPAGLHLDHLCRNRACVNPDHLEPVTNRENTVRGAHPMVVPFHTGRCVSGRHEMTEANTVTRDGGRRKCRACLNEWYRNWRAERRS